MSALLLVEVMTPGKNAKEKVDVREKQMISMIGPLAHFYYGGRMKRNSQRLR